MIRAKKLLLSHAGWLLPAAVFMVAAALRLWQIDLAQFEDDQATLLGGAASFLQTGRIPLDSGMAFSVGIRHPPLVTFLLSIPLLVSRNPIWASAFVAMLDAAGSIFAYLAAKRLAGPRAGLAAGVFYALSPAAIVYGRRIWNPDFVPFFSAVALFCLVDFWLNRSSTSLAVALVAICFAAQLHLLAAIFLPVWLLVALLRRRDVRWRPLGAGLLVVLVVLAPYLYLQTQSGWADLASLRRFLSETKHTDATAIFTAAGLLGADIYHQLLSPATSELSLSVDAVGWLFLAAVLAGTAISAWRRSGGALIVAVWLLLPVALSIRHSTPIAPHYLLTIVPAAAILAGLAFDAIRPSLLGLALLAIPLVWELGAYGRFQLALGAVGPGTSYGIPLRYSVRAADVARSINAGSTLYVGNPDDDAGIFPRLLHGQMPVKRFDSRYNFVFSGSSDWYLVDADGYAYQFLRELIGPPQKAISTPAGLPVFAFYHVPGDAAARFQTSSRFRPLKADLGHAVNIQGYELGKLAAGEASPVTIEWQVTDPHASIPSELRQFAHLVDASGKTWSSNEDFRGYPRSQWAAGDIVLSQFELNIEPSAPTGGYWLETGFYEPVSNTPIPRFDGQRQAGTSVRFGPLKVLGRDRPGKPPAPPRATFGQDEVGLISASWQGPTVTLTWYSIRKPLADYTVFVHVLNSQGQVVGQNDSPPKGGTYPTTLWDQGETVVDAHSVGVSPSSGLRLEVGMYTQPDLRRLPVSEPGSGVEDHVTIAAPR